MVLFLHMPRWRAGGDGPGIIFAWRVVQEYTGADVHDEQDDGKAATHAEDLVTSVVCKESTTCRSNGLSAAIQSGEEGGWEQDGEDAIEQWGVRRQRMSKILLLARLLGASGLAQWGVGGGSVPKFVHHQQGKLFLG